MYTILKRHVFSTQSQLSICCEQKIEEKEKKGEQG